MTDPRPHPADPGPEPDLAQLHPLLPLDPPEIGGYQLDARVTASPSGVAYVAHDEVGSPVMLVMLSEGATGDAAAVQRFAGAVNQMHIDTVLARGGRGQDEGRLAHRFRADAAAPDGPTLDPLASWAALAYTGRSDAVHEAERLLADVDLSWLPPKGAPAGPDYRLPWVDKVAPGLSRMWPLAWPGRNDRAGWLSILMSWIIMMLLMALAILIAILLFQSAPPQAPPPPIATSGEGTGSPSPQSGSPSPDSASPSQDSPSPGSRPSETAGGGSPSPDSKL